MIILSIDRATGEFIQNIEELDEQHQEAMALALVRAAMAIHRCTEGSNRGYPATELGAAE